MKNLFTFIVLKVFLIPPMPGIFLIGFFKTSLALWFWGVEEWNSAAQKKFQSSLVRWFRMIRLDSSAWMVSPEIHFSAS